MTILLFKDVTEVNTVSSESKMMNHHIRNNSFYKKYNTEQEIYEELKKKYDSAPVWGSASLAEMELLKRRTDKPGIFHAFNADKAKKHIGEKVYYSDRPQDKWEIGVLEFVDMCDEFPFGIKDGASYAFIKPRKLKEISIKEAEKMLEKYGDIVKIKKRK